LVDDARYRVVEYISFIRGQRKSQKYYSHTLNESKLKTLNDVFQYYKENELNHRRTVAGRIHALEVSYRCHLKQAIGNTPVDEITKKVVRDMFHKLEPQT